MLTVRRVDMEHVHLLAYAAVDIPQKYLRIEREVALLAAGNSQYFVLTSNGYISPVPLEEDEYVSFEVYEIRHWSRPDERVRYRNPVPVTIVEIQIAELRFLDSEIPLWDFLGRGIPNERQRREAYLEMLVVLKMNGVVTNQDVDAAAVKDS